MAGDFDLNDNDYYADTLTEVPESSVGVRTWEEQLARQEELEDIGLTRGRARFLKALHKAEAKGRHSQMGGAHSLLLKALAGIENGIVEWIASYDTKRGMRPVPLKWLKLLEPDTLAYLTVKSLLDGMHQPRSLYSLSQSLASSVQDELVYRELRARKPALFQYLTSKKFLTQHYQHNARILRGAVKANGVDVAHLKMTKAEKIHVGTKLIDIAVTTTGLFEVNLVTLTRSKGSHHLRKNAKRDQWQVTAAPETVEWVARKNELLQWMHPMALPMVVPPIPWAPGREPGGYRYGLRGKYELVRGVSPAQQETIRKAHMPDVYLALNHIQSTPWRINGKVLDVLNALAELGGGVAGIPLLEPEPLPAKPQDIETNRESRKQWRAQAHATITRNTLRAHDALKWHRIVREAALVRDEPTIFFPHNLDFRGRVYPIATHLSPQGDDLCKGLLTFAEGKPIGESGIEALAIHGANCMDTDPDTQEKLAHQSLARRIAWVRDHTDEILRTVSNPVEEAWWRQADEPLQFLAFCFEWAKVQEEGAAYICALPVYIDGSCNGLQHFSAMFLDEVGGEAVNLTESELPQDIYQRICDSVTRMLRNVPDGHPDVLLARRWLSSGLLTRKLTKRPTMTFGYGSKVFGFQDQLIEYLSTDLRDSWEQTKVHFTVDGSAQTLQACRLLARYIWEALRQNVVKAFEGMEWLQAAARAVVRSTGEGVHWTVPATGFPVRQEYYHQQKRAVATILSGRVIKPRLYENTTKPLATKQANGMAPNVVHSLDAAALVLAVRGAMDLGITSFGAIHDSYGTVPADMDSLGLATRRAFVQLYADGLVPAVLYEQFVAQSGSDIPSPPSPGTLDVSEVLKSDYFFA